jgi:hypothetical protein
VPAAECSNIAVGKRGREGFWRTWEAKVEAKGNPLKATMFFRSKEAATEIFSKK